MKTIFSILESDERSKNFYDIYLIYTKEWKNIDINHFRKAINKTFTRREYSGDLHQALDIVRNSESPKERWNKYRRGFSYAEDIEFDEIIDCLEKMIEELEPVGV